MADDRHFPIKVVLPDPAFHVVDESSGGSRKVFDAVTRVVRDGLIERVARVEEGYRDVFLARPNVPAVAKVKLKRDALAKSHRPTRLFAQDSCPIIGVGTFRELFVRVTPSGLRTLQRRIEADSTQEGIANISTVEDFAPVNQLDRLGVASDQEAALARGELIREDSIKVQLFDHHDSSLNERVFQAFSEDMSSLGVEILRTTEYTPTLVIHQVSVRQDRMNELLEHPGIRRAAVMPRFFSLRHASIPVSDALTMDLPKPVPGQEYPVVGVVDSGVADGCTPLQPWIVGREEFVATDEQNREHGTFVAGLIILGEDVNVPRVVDTGGPSQVLDVVVIPNDDDRRGPTGILTEDQLVATLRDVVPRYSDRVKVWNLSLGSDELCSDAGFSDFGQVLDAIQYEHGVQFVLASGNLSTLPLRTWPPQADMAERDRICSPADSVSSITVGSLAHATSLQSLVKMEEPSPFSRRGPGPAYLVKPDVVNYGGNCSGALEYQSTGVRSLDTLARVAEDIGTSFATPIVSALLANIVNGFDHEPSINLAKALLIHAARYPRDDGDQPINYYGFGRPGPFENVVEARSSSATLVFEDVLSPGARFVLDDFPFPACLIKNGRSTGHIRMTLVYNPPLDSAYGLEYCRANVSASLGTWGPAVNKSTGELQYVRQVPPDPSLSVSAFEEDLVRHGFKWCPVKSYKRDFARGVNARDWRLAVELLHRHDQTPSRQPFVLVITITGDPDEPVYDDTVAALRTYQTVDLTLKSVIRQRLRSQLS